MAGDLNSTFKALTCAAEAIGVPTPGGDWRGGGVIARAARLCCGALVAPWREEEEFADIAQAFGTLAAEAMETEVEAADREQGAEAPADSASSAPFNPELMGGGVKGLKDYAMFLLAEAGGTSPGSPLLPYVNELKLIAADLWR